MKSTIRIAHEGHRDDGDYYEPPTHSLEPHHYRLGGLHLTERCRWCGAHLGDPRLDAPCVGKKEV